MTSAITSWMIKGCQSPNTYETKIWVIHFSSPLTQTKLISVEPYLAVSILASIHPSPKSSQPNPVRTNTIILSHLKSSSTSWWNLRWNPMPWPVLSLLSSFLATCLVHILPAALVFIWFLDYIFLSDLCSSHDFLLECSIHDHLMASPVTQVSALMPPSQRSPLSPPATSLSTTPASSNSLRYSSLLATAVPLTCPHLPHEFNGTQAFFLSLSLLHLQWLESYSVKEGVNEKIHKRTSDKTELTDNASLKLPPETERLHTFQCVIGWI